MAKDPWKEQVGARLRAICREFGITTAVGLGQKLGVDRARANTWFTGAALPPVNYMMKLCTDWRLTLDLIYRGDPDGVRQSTYVRIMAIMEGHPPPDTVSEDPAEVAEGRAGEAVGKVPRPRASRKRRASTAAASGTSSKT